MINLEAVKWVIVIIGSITFITFISYFVGKIINRSNGKDFLEAWCTGLVAIILVWVIIYCVYIFLYEIYLLGLKLVNTGFFINNLYL